MHPQESNAVEVARPDRRSSDLQATEHNFGGTLFHAKNEPFIGNVHVCGPCWSGTGLDGWARMQCTCGFIGPKREQSDDLMSTKLAMDKQEHLNAVRNA